MASPLPHRLFRQCTVSVLIIAELARGADGAEISNQISALGGELTNQKQAHKIISYRPIAFASVLFTMADRLVYNYLSWHMNTIGLLQSMPIRLQKNEMPSGPHNPS